jgi:hypothetical protein
MTFELVRIGWPNSAAIAALILLPVVAMTGGIAKPLSAPALAMLKPAASCPATGQALTLLNGDGPALPLARS